MSTRGTKSGDEATGSETGAGRLDLEGELDRFLAPLAREAPVGLRPGLVIGRFELVRDLEPGGPGVVWEARDRDIGRSVAMRFLTFRRPVLETDEAAREATAIARLSHPNILTLFDVGTWDHGPYVVHALLRGGTLAQRLGQGPIAIGEALRIAGEVARALVHAHDAGAIHGALTAANVFLCEDGTAVVGFWPALLDAPVPVAPEQGIGVPASERTDVYALGLLLFEMLSGQRPFQRQGSDSWPGSTAPRLRVTLSGPGFWARVRRVLTGGAVEDRISDLVARMLANDPAKRPGAAEVERSLSALVRVAPESATVEAIGRPEERPTGASQEPGALGVLLGDLAATTVRSPAIEGTSSCRSFAAALEEAAFLGEEPSGPVGEHLRSCASCAERLRRERAVYAEPPDLRARVLESAGVAPSTAVETPSVRDREQAIQALLAKGDAEGAVTAAIRWLGPEILGYLHAVCGSPEEAAESFSAFAEAAWKGMSDLPPESSVRVWAYRLARKVAAEATPDPWRRRRGSPTATSGWADTVHVKSRQAREALDALRDSLDPDERTLLILRTDRGLSWKEVAEVLAEHGAPLPEAEVALRHRLGQIKEKLAKLGRESGPLD